MLKKKVPLKVGRKMFYFFFFYINFTGVSIKTWNQLVLHLTFYGTQFVIKGYIEIQFVCSRTKISFINRRERIQTNVTGVGVLFKMKNYV
jgi:hypothetical protein